jgi:hypothetical protein
MRGSKIRLNYSGDRTPLNRHPHELIGLHITITHMIALHRALFEWLIMGTPPVSWQLECLHPDIYPLASAHVGPYPLVSITAATSLTKGHPWRSERSISVGPSSNIAWSFPATARPPYPHPTELPSSAPTGHLSDLQFLFTHRVQRCKPPASYPWRRILSSPPIWTEKRPPLLRNPLPVWRRRQRQPRQLPPPLNGTSLTTPCCLAEPSASALIGPKDGMLIVDASTPRKHNPCS